MKFVVSALLFCALACKSEAPAVTATVDTREPIGIWYVGAPELSVREQPNDTAAVLATYGSGEAVSVLAEKGDWMEVRLGDRAGWAKKADLTNAEGKKELEKNPAVRFRIMPLPVSAPSAHGEIYIEADVNSDGEVVTARVLENTTGSPALANQNASALLSAKFYPIVQKGERTPFKYYHRVTY